MRKTDLALSYEASIDYLEMLYQEPFLPASVVGLRRVAFLLDRLDNPHRRFRSVHVAGSSGKGSTTTMIGHVLQAAGLKTGYFRSPHLVSYRERVAIDEVPISREDWVCHLDRIIPIAERMRVNGYDGYDMGRPALFEILFALAASHFAAAGVEWAAMETGLGGRLDATNLLESDISVITNISLEHTQILGSTVTQIAAEKAAIIKPGQVAVTAAEDPRALNVIAARAAEQAVPLILVGSDVHVARRREQGALRLESRGVEVQIAWHDGPSYQEINVATAFAAALALRSRGVSIPEDALRLGLEGARVPGRMEWIEGTPRTLLDGAHNPGAMRALAASLERSGLRPDVLLFAAMEDKDIESMAGTIGPGVQRVVVTSVPGSHRGSALDRVERAFALTDVPVEVEGEVGAALSRAQELAGEGMLLVAGSMYLVGWVRNVLLGDSE